MLCFERIAHSVITLSLLALLAGCTARPLYSTAGTQSTGTQADAIVDKLWAIDIDEAKDRDTQILRNQLSYLIAHQRTQSTPKLYRLSLQVTTQTIATVQVDVGDRTDRIGRPSAGTIRARADYVLRDLQGKTLAKGQRSMSAPFDRPRQEYANLQAEEDARKRALQELSQQIFFALANDFSKM